MSAAFAYPYEIYKIPEMGLVDFHSHILPAMDDGSSSVDESLQMLRLSLEQGVGCIAATPHFYADRDNPSHFLAKCEDRMRRLTEAYGKAHPILMPGAEVAYFEGITSMDELGEMRIGNSECLLVEMPMGKWTGRMVDNVLEIQYRSGFSVIIAHIERYIKYQSNDVIAHLLDNGVRMQANAGYFLNRWTSRKALSLLEDGVIKLIGSDCHNLTSRPPNLKKACDSIENKCGREFLDHVMARSRYLLKPRRKTQQSGAVQNDKRANDLQPQESN